MNPREAAQRAELSTSVPGGAGDRFAGYAVIGLPFRSGEVLALRRFVACSSGPAYTSVWHRDAKGRWVFYSDVDQDQGCGRYFSKALAEEVMKPIRLEWMDEDRLRVVVEGALQWELRLRETAMARAMNASGEWMPESWWEKRGVLRAMGAMAGVALGAGDMRLTGRTPNGHEFIAKPQHVWMVVDSQAQVAGRDLGAIGPLEEQASLGDFLIPQRGVFAMVEATLLAPQRWRAA